MSPRHAYLHVPFCRHRCGYCDFPLVAGRDDLVEGYFRALEIELERLAEPLRLDTLYLGGGTPSQLGPEGLRRLFGLLSGRLLLSPEAEVTLEANPLDVTGPLIEAVVECGITRVSLGGQSLDAATLIALDRDHAPDDVRHAVELLARAGLAVSCDLMIAAPGQTLTAVQRDLRRLVSLDCGHLSVYCLTWEPGTAFEVARRNGRLAAVDEELERAMFLEAIDRLTAAGYEHEEVSNFARPGCRCRHNEAYWLCRPWEAFGPGAARFDGRVRLTNHRSVTTWIRRLLAGEDPVADRDVMNDEEAARERLVLGLRRREGVDRAAFREESGFDLDSLACDAIRRWRAVGLVEDDSLRLRLTREGLLVSDSLWADVLEK